MFENTGLAKKARLFAAGMVAGLLVACGGGSDGCSSLDPARNSDLPGCSASTSVTTATTATASGTGTTTTTTSVASTSIALSLSDASGATITSVSPDRAGTIKALVTDSRGVVVPNVAVTFTTSDSTGAFVPASGTALSDASGLARVGLPAGTQAGAFTVTANTLVGNVATLATVGYAVSFATLKPSDLSIIPATLSAGGNASVSVSLSNGSSPYMPPLSVSFSSPCVSAGKASIGSPVLSQGGIATASYTDKGCGAADMITASVALGGATVTKAGTINVLPAAAGSIKFISATTTNIALKGTGGFGRQEFSTLTFQVFDRTGNPVAGTPIDLVFADSNTTSTVGGLALNPSAATSAADGTVTTLVAAGTIPTSVRVVASVHGSTPPITTLSNILVVSTGVPDQKHFSLATEIGNCEGRDLDQTCSTVTATLGDHFGNPVPDGTAVNFTAEGGVIDASCVTGSLPLPDPRATPFGQTTNSKVGPGSGTCSVTLRASSPRAQNGRVTVLAYAVGEESFFDANGNNVFDSGDTFTDQSPDIYRDDNEDGAWNAGEPCVGPNQNGLCSTPGDTQYNGVLRIPQAPSAQTSHVSAQLVQIFSGSFANISFNPATLTCPAGSTSFTTTNVQVTVKDEIGNIMPAATTIGFATLVAPSPLPSSITVPNVVLAVGQPLIIPTYTVTVGCGSGQLSVTVTTPLTKTISTASIPITLADH